MLFLDAQHARITEALDKGELISRRSLNQEKSLKCTGDIHDGIILWDNSQFDFDVLFCSWCTLVLYKRMTYTPFKKLKFNLLWVVNSNAKEKSRYCMLWHLLKCLSNDCRWWKFLLTEVSSFCSKHSILIKNMDEIFVVGGRPQRKTPQITNLHHYSVNLFYTSIDMQLQDLHNCF